MGLTRSQEAYGPADHRMVLDFTRIEMQSTGDGGQAGRVGAATDLGTTVRFWRYLDGKEPQAGWAARPT